MGILSRGPSHGYEIHQTLSREFHQIWDIGQNQTYNILKRLTAQGMVEQVPQIGVSGKEIAQFSLSAQGREHLKEWINQPTAPSMTKMRTEFITRLIFAAETLNQPLEALVLAQIKVLEERLKHLQASSADPEPFAANQLGREVRIEGLNSLLTWLRGLQLAQFTRNGSVKGKD